MNAAAKIDSSEYTLLREVLTTEEVCDLLSLSKHKVYSLAKSGELPGRRVAGRPFRFDRKGILQLVGLGDLTDESDFPDILNKQQLASFLRFHAQTLYAYHAEGRLHLPTHVWIIKSPARFSRRNVLQWIRGKWRYLQEPDDIE